MSNNIWKLSKTIDLNRAPGRSVAVRGGARLVQAVPELEGEHAGPLGGRARALTPTWQIRFSDQERGTQKISVCLDFL